LVPLFPNVRLMVLIHQCNAMLPQECVGVLTAMVLKCPQQEADQEHLFLNAVAFN